MMRFIGEPVTEQEIEVPVVVIEVPGVGFIKEPATEQVI